MTVKDILMLTQVARDSFQVSFDGVDYRPTNDTTFAGTLIFGLKPKLVETDGLKSTELFHTMARVAVYTLNGHVKGRAMPEDALNRWKAGAIALAPCAKTAAVTAGVELAGQVIPGTATYAGINNESLASTIAMRDLRVTSAPLSTARLSAIVAQRQSFVPGDAVVLVSPDNSIQRIRMRITSARYRGRSPGR